MTVTLMSIAPDVLYFFADRLAIGGELVLSRTSGEEFTSTSWLLGPAFRYFFADPGVRTLPFLGGSMSTGRSRSESGGNDFEGSTLSAEGVAGVTQLLSNQVGLTVEAFFRSTRFEATLPAPFPPSETKTTALGARVGISAFLF